MCGLETWSFGNRKVRQQQSADTMSVIDQNLRTPLAVGKAFCCSSLIPQSESEAHLTAPTLADDVPKRSKTVEVSVVPARSSCQNVRNRLKRPTRRSIFVQETQSRKNETLLRAHLAAHGHPEGHHRRLAVEGDAPLHGHHPADDGARDVTGVQAAVAITQPAGRACTVLLLPVPELAPMVPATRIHSHRS